MKCDDCAWKNCSCDMYPCKSCHVEDGNPNYAKFVPLPRTYTAEEVEAWLKDDSCSLYNVDYEDMWMAVADTNYGLAAFVERREKEGKA